MIRLQGRGAAYGELWFDEPPRRDAGVDIFQYRYRDTPVPGAHALPLMTMVTDLRQGEEAIERGFGRDCRYKIRRADTKDGLRAEFISDPAPRLAEFADFYDAFAAQKGQPPGDRHWLEAACRARQLWLSVAWQGETALVWHAYVLCGRTAGMQYTASHFRGQGGDLRSLIGRANRWLHWQDMHRLKARGFERYDWGGLFEDDSTPERAGINRFKRDFGGTALRVYECAQPASVRGRLYLPLRDAWRRLSAAARSRPAAATAPSA